MSFTTLLKISRPRFWHYVLGPMLIYFASSGFFEEIKSSFSRGGTDRIYSLIIMIIILGYFTVPANLWIYGWNDIADGDTDKFNSKKGSYEAKIEDTQTMKNKLKWNIWGWNIGYILIGNFLVGGISYYQWFKIYQPQGIAGGPIPTIVFLIVSIICLFIFLITSYLYSCKPLRAKAKPFIDGIMNILYIATPFSIITIQYIFSPSLTYNLQLIIYNFFAALFWCMAMHCYSAIPDIEPDRQAGLTTTAVYLGKQSSLIYCAILYLLSATLSFPTLGWFSIIGGVMYISLMILSYYRKDIFALYKLFPYINLIIGFFLFIKILYY